MRTESADFSPGRRAESHVDENCIAPSGGASPSLQDIDGVAVAARAAGIRRAPPVRCENCEFQGVCPAALCSRAEHAAHAYFLHKGGTLFRAGRGGRHMYLLRAGSLKTFVDTLDGEYQLTAFHLPGELIGFDLSGEDDVSQPYTTVAMERSQLCEVDCAEGEAALIRQRLYRLIGGELRQLHANRAMVGRSMAHQRVALFLLDLSERQRRLRRVSDVLHLPMSRLDIASFLGLAVETVSRVFTRLQLSGVISVDLRTVRLLDRARLLALSCVYEAMPEHADAAAHARTAGAGRNPRRTARGPRSALNR